MKKTIIATAVATVFASGVASAAGTYGNIRLGLQNTDEMALASGKLVFGFKGSEDLGNGMELGFGIEWEHDNAQQEIATVQGGTGVTTTGLSNDKSWVSLGGGFGKIILGEYGDFAGWACGGTDILTIGSAEACDFSGNTSPSHAIQYRGGAGAVNFGVLTTFDGSGDSATKIGIGYSDDVWGVGAQFNTVDDAVVAAGTGADESNVIGGHYNMGDITLGISMGDNGADDDSSAMDLGLSMPVGAGSLGVVFTDGDALADASTDVTYSQGLGKMGYWGVEYNGQDGRYNGEDSRMTAWIGTKF